MDRFKGKTALITGGTTGIGLATAKLFLNEGARVIVTGRAAATIKTAQAELGENAIVVRSDATSLSDMDALAAKVNETFGKLDVLFVNAGYGHFVPFEQVTEEVYDEMLNLNAKGPYFIVQKLVPLMPEGSSVVFTTSLANVKAVPTLSAYGAAKAALRSITRSLASGLSGNYDVSVEFSMEATRNAMRMASASAAPDAAAEPPGITFMDAVREQLGLKLESTKAPVPMLVIDHMERPSEN